MSGERWEDPHGKLRGDLDFIARFCCRWSQFLAFVSKKKIHSGEGSDAVGLFRRLIPSAG